MIIIPLLEGSSDEIIQKNIDMLIAEGYDPKQATAIAYEKAGRTLKDNADHSYEYLKALHTALMEAANIPPEIKESLHVKARAVAGGQIKAKNAESEKEVAEQEGLKGNLRTNSSQLGGKVIEATDTQTVIPVVLMKERVTNGALKLYSEFAPHAHWFEGVPIIPPHKAGDPPANHLTQKAGKIRNVKLNADKKRVEAEAILFNDRIAPGDLQRIKAGEPFGGSIGYYCNDEKLSDPQTWEDGTEYKSIERGPFFADHFSMVPVGACPLPECGFNVNAQDDSMTDVVEPSITEVKVNADVKPAEVIPPQVNVAVDLSTVLTKLDAIGTEVAGLKANIASKDAEIASLKQSEELRANAAKAQAEAAAKAGFRSILKANFQAEVETLYPAYVANPAMWIVTNADKLDLAQKAVIEPTGQAFVPHVNTETENPYEAAGEAAAASMIKGGA